MTPSTSLSSVLVSIVSFIVLDGLWLGLVMTNFYRTQLMGIGRIVDGVFAPSGQRLRRCICCSALAWQCSSCREPRQRARRWRSGRCSDWWSTAYDRRTTRR